MCTDIEDIKKRSNWNSENSRSALLSELQSNN